MKKTIVTGATVAAVVLLFGTGGQAAVNISTQATQNMNCSGGVCTATAQKAYLNVTDLTNMLAAGDLKVATGFASNEDIHVEASFSWTSGSRLTLDAQRSIEFKQSVTVAGVGGITLITNDGGVGGDYWFDTGASITFWDTFSSLVINGEPYKIATDLKSLASGIAANPSASFALANDYDASVDGTYRDAVITTEGFGAFEGLGHTIANLSMKNTKKKGGYLGLFARAGSLIRDLAITNAHVVSQTGSGSLTGMLVGYLDGGGYVTHCSAQGVVKASQGNVGGLVGQNYGTIAQSSTSASVSGGAPAQVGGLVGYNFGFVSSSSSRGSVTGAA